MGTLNYSQDISNEETKQEEKVQEPAKEQPAIDTSIEPVVEENK